MIQDVVVVPNVSAFYWLCFPIRTKAEEKTDRHLNPLSVLHRVDELMAEDSIIVADGGDFVGSAAYIMRPRGPLRWLDPGQNCNR